MATKAKPSNINPAPPAVEADEDDLPTGTDLATVDTGGAVTNWEDEMAREAAVAAKMEQNSGGGQFFSVKSGRLSFADAPIPNDQMAVIILDSMMENVFYEADYDPDSPASPVCFAFGRAEEEMVPHDVVFENGTAQSPQCKTCQWNEWGSADKGRGKACKNGRRLAMIGAGSLDKDGVFTLDEDPESFSSGVVGYLRVPVTSVKGYATYVNQVANVLKRPPYGVITKVRVVPDSKTQLRVIFEVLCRVPDDLMQIVMTRAKEAKATIGFPYRVGGQEEAQEAPPPAKRVVQQPARQKPAAVPQRASAPASRQAAPAAAPRKAKY